ncbi:MAG: hypothetical protein R2713_12070 [Ilumatobacteraceae bacterium]
MNKEPPMNFRTLTAFAMSASLLTLAACGDDDEDATPTTTAATAATTPVTDEPAAEGDIVAVAAANPSFTTLVAAVQAAGLVETLQGAGPFTVLRPPTARLPRCPTQAPRRPPAAGERRRAHADPHLPRGAEPGARGRRDCG